MNMIIIIINIYYKTLRTVSFNVAERITKKDVDAYLSKGLIEEGVMSHFHVFLSF